MCMRQLLAAVAAVTAVLFVQAPMAPVIAYNGNRQIGIIVIRIP